MLRTIAATIATILTLGVAGPASAGDASDAEPVTDLCVNEVWRFVIPVVYGNYRNGFTYYRPDMVPAAWPSWRESGRADFETYRWLRKARNERLAQERACVNR